VEVVENGSVVLLVESLERRRIARSCAGDEVALVNNSTGF
jgi:hypothetical protein